ncbi:hypothetical protein M8J76_008349 [Diaphorina citri]|nr:hypothetical protein M8J76_008349 [Diaphorina citri]
MTKRKTKFKKMENDERYTATEIPVSQLVSRAQEEHTKHDKQMKIIEQSISYLHELNNLELESFYCIHINWHCVATQSDRNDELNKVKVFYPAEIAISEFNIKQGLVRRFNKFINPTLPMGYASEAKERRDRYHRLPLDNEQGESDLNVVYAEMINFLTRGQANGSIPPLYTREDNVMSNTSITGVCSVLKTLYYHKHTGASFAEAALSGDEWESEFKVYPLKKLLFELGKLYVPKTMIDMDIAEIILDKDPYMYQDGIACPLHTELDSIQNCSLSMVSRWPMVIREVCISEAFKKEKLIIPPIESTSNSSAKSKSSTPSQPNTIEHEKLYPAMKGKDTNSASDQMTFVHSPQHQAPTPASNVSAGSAWAKPLVYQAPGNGYSPSSPGGSGQNSATDNFPPLGGMRISSQNTDKPKKNQNQKRNPK